jgi:osmotically-inducible protein OsmY
MQKGLAPRIITSQGRKNNRVAFFLSGTRGALYFYSLVLLQAEAQMGKQRSFAVLIVALLLGAGGCASTSEKGSAGAYFGDAAITTRVKTAIFNEPGLKVMDISVNTEGKVVQLSGSVKSRADRTKVSEVARKVEGVKGVKNELQVK